MAWFLGLAVVLLLSWLGWRLNQLETAALFSRESRFVKRLRRGPKRRKHHH